MHRHIVVSDFVNKNKFDENKCEKNKQMVENHFPALTMK